MPAPATLPAVALFRLLRRFLIARIRVVRAYCRCAGNVDLLKHLLAASSFLDLVRLPGF